MLSVITTNVFPDTKIISFLVQNLSDQTFQDFEWIFVDGYYNENKELIQTLCKDKQFKTVHVPACHSPYPRIQHWELYNTGLLLASRPLFFRFGTYRFFGKYTLQKVVEYYYEKNYFVDFCQIRVPENVIENYKMELFDEYQMGYDAPISKPFYTAGGFFSSSKEFMLSLNGEDEAALALHHWEDCELDARAIQYAGPIMVRISKGMLRIEHRHRPQGYNLKTTTSPCGREKCLVFAPVVGSEVHHIYPFYKDSAHQERRVNQNSFAYRGFKWVYCPDCGVMSPYDCHEYFDFLKEHKQVAPIGVNGFLGRDLRIIHEDLKQLNSLESKIMLLESSYTNKRYLQDV